MSTEVFPDPPAAPPPKPKRRRKRAQRPYVPAQRAQDIFASVARYHLLTGEQTIRLHGRPSIRSNIFEHLKKLTDAGYLKNQDFLPHPMGLANAKSFWSIGERGRAILKERGVFVLPERHSQSTYDDDTLRHVQAINDCLIDLEIYCRYTTGWELSAVRHDLELKRVMAKTKVMVLLKRTRHVELGDGLFRREEVEEPAQILAIPDAFTQLTQNIHGIHRAPAFWWEIDLSGSEEERKWKEKIAAIIAFYQSGAYAEEFGTTQMIVAVPVYKGESRMNRLLTWTEQVLEKQNLSSWGNNFRFTVTKPGDPALFLNSKHWVVPFTRRNVSLLEQVAI